MFSWNKSISSLVIEAKEIQFATIIFLFSTVEENKCIIQLPHKIFLLINREENNINLQCLLASALIFHCLLHLFKNNYRLYNGYKACQQSSHVAFVHYVLLMTVSLYLSQALVAFFY